MMGTRNKFWWFVLLALCLTGITLITLGVFFWQDLTPEEKTQLTGIFVHHPTYFFMASILVIAAVGFALDGALNSYILPLNRLLEAARIVLSVNPRHRIQVDGSQLVRNLADLVNRMAERIESTSDQVAAHVAVARESCEREKNILAAMVAELPHGVIICNPDHRVILYNRRAKRLLERSGDQDRTRDDDNRAAGRFLGLDRPVTALVDAALIRYAMEEAIQNLDRNASEPAARFVITGSQGELIQSEMVPVLDSRREITAYILTFSDITERMERRQRASQFMGRLITRARASLAGIRSAIESMVAYPDMTDDQRNRLRTIIHDEAVVMSDLLDESADQLADSARSSWPLMPVRLRDLFQALQRHAVHCTPPRAVTTGDVDDTLWIRADSYLLLSALETVMDQAVSHDGATGFDITGSKGRRSVQVDLVWQGPPVSRARIQQWMDDAATGAIQEHLSLEQILQRHDGELVIWKASDPSPDRTGIRMLLPGLTPPQGSSGPAVATVPAGRPEFYDFDLFHQPGQAPDIDRRPLTSQAYTVFDTETTGLNPRGGDEILSIGAVRIVNQRLLREECFDHLVNPRRQIPWESIKYHGIHHDMVADKPAIDQVLPQFHQFAADTVLVGHNVAFDMRMLQMKEADTGIYFFNPVLDTLLLSIVVHPNHRDHSLEAIAQRLGVAVEARHTAMGDAMTTAQVFLKMLPLLKQMGIHTLLEARRASLPFQE